MMDLFSNQHANFQDTNVLSRWIDLHHWIELICLRTGVHQAFCVVYLHQQSQEIPFLLGRYHQQYQPASPLVDRQQQSQLFQ